MKKSLEKQLATLDETGFQEMNQRLEKANWIRNLQSAFNYSMEDLARESGIDLGHLEKMKFCAVAHTDLDVARLRAVDVETSLRKALQRKNMMMSQVPVEKRQVVENKEGRKIVDKRGSRGSKIKPLKAEA